MSMAIVGGVAAVAGAAATVYGATQSGGDAPMPVMNNPGRDLLRYTQGLQTALPDIIGLEQQYRGEFGELNLDDIAGALLGMGGKPGLFDLGAEATRRAQADYDATRQDEFDWLLGNIGNARDAVASTMPLSMTEAAERQRGIAADRYASSRGLTDEEMRGVQQTTREAFADRGRIEDNSSIFAEAMGREEVLARKRQEAQQANATLFGMGYNQTSPTLSLLGMARSPASLALGQDYLSRGVGAVGTNVPQMVSTSTALDIGAQNTANLNAWNQANAAAEQGRYAAIGQAGAGLLNAGMTFMGY